MNSQPPILETGDSIMAPLGQLENISQNPSCDSILKKISTSTQTEVVQLDKATEEDVRKIFAEGLTAIICDSTREMQQELQEAEEQMKRQVMDLQKLVVNGFQKIMEKLEKIREDLEAKRMMCYGVENEQLQQENYRLRQKLNMLKKKLPQGRVD